MILMARAHKGGYTLDGESKALSIKRLGHKLVNFSTFYICSFLVTKTLSYVAGLQRIMFVQPIKNPINSLYARRQ